MMFAPRADEDTAMVAMLFDTLEVTLAEPKPDAICVNLLESWTWAPLYRMDTTSPLAVLTDKTI